MEKKIGLIPNEALIFQKIKELADEKGQFGKKEIVQLNELTGIILATIRGFLCKLVSKGLLKRIKWGRYEILGGEYEIIPARRSSLFKESKDSVKGPFRIKSKGELKKEIIEVKAQIEKLKVRKEKLEHLQANYEEIVHSSNLYLMEGK